MWPYDGKNLWQHSYNESLCTVKIMIMMKDFVCTKNRVTGALIQKLISRKISTIVKISMLIR